MGSITVVTGGARSGKSTFAEEQLENLSKICYIATGISNADDQEMTERIKQHQQQRGNKWQTHEGFLAIPQFINTTKTQFDGYLLDCATLLSTNYVFHLLTVEWHVEPKEFDNFLEEMTVIEFQKIENRIKEEWEAIIEQMRETKAQCLIVTNEIGLGIVPETKFSRLFRDLQGRVNQLLAKEANDVYLVISGIPLQIK